MPHSTILVTVDSTIIEQVRHICDESESAHLEVCGRIEKALTWLSGRNQLVLIDSRIDGRSIELALAAARRLGVPGGIVCSSADASFRPAAADPLRRANASQEHEVFSLPACLPALRRLIQSLRADTTVSAGNLDLDSAAGPLLRDSIGADMAVIRRMAEQATTVLLTGETGCGKTMLARLIHDSSTRRGQPYMVIDCGALSDHLIESELFGHVRGAFTGADRDRAGKLSAAGIGTLVLDEINSLPMSLQAKLLRAVEDRVFEPVGSNRSEVLRARLIAVSNMPLEEEVRAGRFRSDLYYRLNIMELRLPPLRERREAIEPLALQFLRKLSPCPESAAIAPPALAALLDYSWPGNVRELRNAIERATVLGAGPRICLEDLPASVRGGLSSGGSQPNLSGTMGDRLVAKADDTWPWPTGAAAADVGDERTSLLTLLHKHRNNRCRAARDLGISRMTLYKKLHKYGIFEPKAGGAARRPE